MFKLRIAQHKMGWSVKCRIQKLKIFPVAENIKTSKMKLLILAFLHSGTLISRKAN